MHVLITGIAGFVGSSIARKFTEEGYKVIGVDDLSAGYERRLQDYRRKIDFRIGKVEDILPNLHQKCDVVINCAATAPLPTNEIDHFSALKNNVATCGAVMQYAARHKVNRVIHFSSSAVYEGIENSDVKRLHEDLDLHPKLMYPTSKYLSEIYMKTQAHVHSIPTFSLRLFNLYGPHQDYFRKQPPLLGYLFKCLIRSEVATLFGKVGCKRDYVYIDDLISLIKILIFEAPKNGIYEALNVGSGRSYDVFDLVHEIENLTGQKMKISKQEPKNFWDNYQAHFGKKIILPDALLEAEVNKLAFCDLTLARTYGFRPKVSIREGLQSCHDTAKEYIS